MRQKTIGWAAKEAGVNTQTVLYYERRGLLPEPSRSFNGYRLFNDISVQRIFFIKRAQKLGFTLKQIAALLALQGDHNSSCAEVSAMALSHLEKIKSKILDLQRMKDALLPLVNACPKKGALNACPIMDSLKGSK
ncbi:MerR family transcriptional regulator [Ghiorsea bivora]|uniref:MerR family transcriptional regulator n=1 Tax=Ghiorsea bivora TaxID=1485545 RepID=UPI0005718ECA|nr:MerR family DNA-binding protein [Ghiorsea bivora]